MSAEQVAVHRQTAGVVPAEGNGASKPSEQSYEVIMLLRQQQADSGACCQSVSEGGWFDT